MNDHQKKKLRQLEEELKRPQGSLPVKGERDGYVFTEVDGVTVLITAKSKNARGGYKLPAVRSYLEEDAPTNLDAARRAQYLFQKQSLENDYDTGHMGPVVDTEWRCGSARCLCRKEDEAQRKARSVGRKN